MSTTNVTFVVPRLNDKVFEKYLKPSLSKYDCQSIEMFDEKGQKDSIFTKYNKAISVLKEKGMQEDDVIVFLHEDVILLENNIVDKLKLTFSQKKDIGILGIVGCNQLNESSKWWEQLIPNTNMKGHLIQGNETNDGRGGFHLIKGEIGYYNNLVALDGCFLAASGKFLLSTNFKFDEETYIGHNDFYDIDACLTCLELGWKVAVVDLLIFHASVGKGSLQEPWHQARDKFINKWQKTKNIQFPITINTFQKNVVSVENPSNIIEIEI
jgi:hypothetical protein